MITMLKLYRISIVYSIAKTEVEIANSQLNQIFLKLKFMLFKEFNYRVHNFE